MVGLAVADVVTYTSLRSSLYGRIDAQLDVAQQQAYRYLIQPTRARGPDRRPCRGASTTRVEPRRLRPRSLGHNGRILVSHPSGSATAPRSPAAVPPRSAVQSVPPAHVFGRDEGAYQPEPDAFG